MEKEIDQHAIALDSTLEDELTNIITATSLESTLHEACVGTAEQSSKYTIKEWP